MSDAYRILSPTADPVPLVFDSPHSGSIYPADFNHVIDRMTLRRSEDAHIDELFSGVTRHGAAFLHALFPRSYVDPNRAEDDIDLGMIDGDWPHPVAPSTKTLDRGVGLIWKEMRVAGPIYDRKLTVAEVEARIEGYWRPYHDALAGLLDEAHARHKRVVHINCHSMSSMGDRLTEDGPVARPDFIVSDRDGTSCAPELTEWVVRHLEAAGYRVAVNDPYKGFELVRRHGRPVEQRHSLQIEINRGLYMDEATLSKHQGFLALQTALEGLTGTLAALAARI